MPNETTTTLAEPPVAEIAPAPVDELVEMLRAAMPAVSKEGAEAAANIGVYFYQHDLRRLLTWANARRDAAVEGACDHMTPTIPDEAVDAAIEAWDNVYEAQIEAGSSRYTANEPAAMRAALTAAVPLMVGWRPIEGEPDTTKAPWDGKPVILGNRAGSWTGKYEPVYQSGYRPENPWFSLMLNCRHMGKYPSLVPTHWQPLPEPPNHPATETREDGRG